MSAGVLAVMDEVRERFVNLRELSGFGESDLTPQLTEARATVGSAFEALRQVQESLRLRHLTYAEQQSIADSLDLLTRASGGTK